MTLFTYYEVETGLHSCLSLELVNQHYQPLFYTFHCTALLGCLLKGDYEIYHNTHRKIRQLSGRRFQRTSIFCSKAPRRDGQLQGGPKFKTSLNSD